MFNLYLLAGRSDQLNSSPPHWCALFWCKAQWFSQSSEIHRAYDPHLRNSCPEPRDLRLRSALYRTVNPEAFENPRKRGKIAPFPSELAVWERIQVRGPLILTSCSCVMYTNYARWLNWSNMSTLELSRARAPKSISLPASSSASFPSACAMKSRPKYPKALHLWLQRSACWQQNSERPNHMPWRSGNHANQGRNRCANKNKNK